jgi:hypothetical protein
MLVDLIARIREHRWGSMKERLTALAEELNRLDPRDFIPAEQFAFTQLRAEARHFATIRNKYWYRQLEQHNKAAGRIRSYTSSLEGLGPSQAELLETIDVNIMAERCITDSIDEWSSPIAASLENIKAVLDSYGGVNSNAAGRPFTFIGNADIRTIVERDYRDLSLKLLPSGAWKSVVVTAGGILEGILFDALTRDPARVAAAMASPKAPRRSRQNGGGAKDITRDTREDEWSLADMIHVAADLGYISLDREKSIDQSLRGYRNYVHPRVEVRNMKPLREAEALMAKGSLDAICDDIK